MEGKCNAHDEIVAGVSETRTNIIHIKDTLDILFAKMKTQFFLSVVVIILLAVTIGEKVLPYLFRVALAGV